MMTWQTMNAQQRRPIDSQHPMWMVHIDVWNSADPQKIIDLIPNDIKPYVCMNLSLSCQYDKDLNMYRMPRCAVRTYKSWASVCQLNDMWFTCQPASGGHTHIQDNDLETFEYFFKAYPNFLGWNYAEQFWGFDESDDESSSTQSSRIALFAKLVPMHHQYGGFLTISFCGSVYSHALNPIGMMKRNTELMKACQEYPEAILWLYKYTHPVCFYNNESVTFGPFISGLAKNYGVRYDNCGWNDALSSILGKNNGKSYPGAAGIGTVMEQTCVNGGAVWDGPELIWTEDFQNLDNTTVDGYTRRNWGTYSNFKGIWLDMFRQIINGNMYIPTREEVVGKQKIVVVNDKTSGSDEDKYAAWGDLYDGVYKQTDPFNNNIDGRYGTGQWQNNFCYFKKTGRYGAIPIVTGLYDDVAKSIPVQVRKSNYTSRWSSITKKTNDFNKQYPEVSDGDLYVNRYLNQLVTYTPYTYLNKKKSAHAGIPLLYNTCDSLKLNYGKLSSGVIREYADHIDFYLNNYRSDSTTAQSDTIQLTGVTTKPTCKLTKPKTSATAHAATITDSTYNAEAQTFTIRVKHMGPLNLTVNCSGNATPAEDLLSIPEPASLPIPQQPEPFAGPFIIEAENMDYKSVKNVALTHSGWCAPDYNEFAGMGYVEMGTNTSAALRHQLKLDQAGAYDIYIRYCNTSKEGAVRVTVNNKAQNLTCEKVDKNEWRKLKVSANLKAGTNNLVITNTGGTGMTIDQIIYMPADKEPERFLVTIRDAENGTVSANVSETAEGETVRLTVTPKEGYALKEIRVINSVYYTMAKTIELGDDNEITFTMPDDNVTLQPLFVDVTSAYMLDFTYVAGGTIPEGWRCVQDGNEVHEYPNSFTSGARTIVGFTGHQGKALYWRNQCAEYGRQTNYPLMLQPGTYKLTYAMAAWKGTPSYKVEVLSADGGTAIAKTTSISATPNADGNNTANLKSSRNRELQFSITKAGNYIIRFSDPSTAGGLREFLLLECYLNSVDTDGIRLTDASGTSAVSIFDLSGRQRPQTERGINLIRTADGKVRKMLVK